MEDKATEPRTGICALITNKEDWEHWHLLTPELRKQIDLFTCHWEDGYKDGIMEGIRRERGETQEGDKRTRTPRVTLTPAQVEALVGRYLLDHAIDGWMPAKRLNQEIIEFAGITPSHTTKVTIVLHLKKRLVERRTNTGIEYFLPAKADS